MNLSDFSFYLVPCPVAREHIFSGLRHLGEHTCWGASGRSVQQAGNLRYTVMRSMLALGEVRQKRSRPIRDGTLLLLSGGEASFQ